MGQSDCLSVYQSGATRQSISVGQYICLYLVCESVYQSLHCLLVDCLLGLSISVGLSIRKPIHQLMNWLNGLPVYLSSLHVVCASVYQ